MTDCVHIVEVGPRDGLQNESAILAADIKIEFINQLTQCGFKTIEASSFVSPKWIPQLADATEIFANINRSTNTNYLALVPNLTGLERAIASKVDHIAIFTAASETFNQKNINCSIDESFERFQPIIDQCKKLNIKVRGYVSCILGCPYEGKIAIKQVNKVTQKLIEMGCYEVSLGDTIGAGTAKQARDLIKSLLQSMDANQLAIHFHDTRGQALVNIFNCLDMGIRTIDSSVAGLGGCPYAKGAAGNVASEDLIFMLHGLGMKTNIDLSKLINTGNFICHALNRENRSKIGLAGLFNNN